MTAVIEIDPTALEGLLATLNAGGHADARLVALAPTRYGAAVAVLGQCSLDELKLLTIRDLSAIKRRLAGFAPAPCGPVGSQVVEKP